MQDSTSRHLIYDPVNYYDFYGLCTDQSARFCKLDKIDESARNFLFANVNRWLISPMRKQMITGERYYKNDNDVLDRKRYFFGRQGQQIENKNVSNAKLNHPIFRRLVSQKLGYLLGKLPDIKTENEVYEDLLSKSYLDKNFMKILKIILKEAIVKGIGWLQAYYDEEGTLKFTVIPSEEIFPFWTDSMHTQLDGVIRTYKVQHFKADGSMWIVKLAELYTLQGSWKFIIDNGVIEQVEPQKGHFKLNGSDQNWLQIPFIPFFYNEDCLSLIALVKNLIDAYDLATSDFDNLLRDIPNSIKVVKNYERNENETDDTFTRNLALFRTIFVRDNGGVEALENPIDAASYETHLKRLKKDIFESASGVQDTDDEKFKDNSSGVALAFKYVNLDIEAETISSEFERGFERMKYFIDTDMMLKGLGDFTNEKFEIVFNKNLITNDSNNIASLVSLYQAGLISLDTAIDNNPFVEDREAEVEQIKGDQKEKDKQEQQKMEAQAKIQAKAKPTGGNNK